MNNNFNSAMSEPSSKQYNAGWGQTFFSFTQVVTGIAMVVVGERNLWVDLYNVNIVKHVISRDPLDCANGASEYLFYGGIVIISANVAGILAGCARQAALKVTWIKPTQKKWSISNSEY